MLFTSDPKFLTNSLKQDGKNIPHHQKSKLHWLALILNLLTLKQWCY